MDGYEGNAMFYAHYHSNEFVNWLSGAEGGFATMMCVAVFFF